MNIADLRRGADSGSRVDQSVLGLCYLYGVDVEINYKEAFRLLTSAGTSRAVANLARMYAEGLGISKDVAEAVRLYRAVAKFEFRAQLELGRIYSRGVGVPADPDEALRWYSAAAAREDDDCVDDPINAAFVGSGTFEEVQEAKAYVANAVRG
ncbi:MAG: tetratricopeptide repeat protein [Candidatus Binatus sp.]